VSAESPSNISPKPSEVISEVSDHIFKKRPKKDLKIAPRGPGGGGQNFIFFSEFYYFFLGAHAKV
jgi:hypothetical protein